MAHLHDGDEQHEDVIAAANGMSRTMPGIEIAAYAAPTEEICCISGPMPVRLGIAAAVLTPIANWTLTFVAFTVADFTILAMAFEHYMHSSSSYKVESSPPFLASVTRHTYLHTSVFLI